MTCTECGDEVDELVSVSMLMSVKGRARRVCEECADALRDKEEVADGAEEAMRGMMEYKGRR